MTMSSRSSKTKQERFGLGLCRTDRFHRDGQSFEAFGFDDGLPNDRIYYIQEDDSGKLWFSTDNGLSQFDPASRVFRNYDVQDGLQGDEFNKGELQDQRRNHVFRRSKWDQHVRSGEDSG